MRFLWILLVVWLSFTGLTTAQANNLIAQGTVVAPELDLYGQQVLYAEGMLVNQGDQAYTDISLTAEAYDANGEIVGEGLGYLVNACRAGLLPDFALQPGKAQMFAVPLELYQDGAIVERVEITAQGSSTAPMPAEAAPFLPGITQVSEREVVSVEWIDEDNLRFGAGCYRDLFTRLRWYEYNLKTGVQRAVEHPKAELVTREAMLRQIGLEDPLLLNRAFLSFAPNARRMVYQTDLNSVITAEPDGSFKRVLFNDLANRTLQGIYWLNQGRFLAYYYGAQGDPVLYFTADVEGRVLSQHPVESLPSLITPGASPNGERVIIAATVGDVTGYYLKQAAFDTTDLLFEAEPPGNNWPGPLWELGSDGQTFIYIARPESDGSRLQCFNLQARSLHDLSALPLNLATDERAWWWLSPENNTIALAANGVNGGLWLIDLNAVRSCE